MDPDFEVDGLEPISLASVGSGDGGFRGEEEVLQELYTKSVDRFLIAIRGDDWRSQTDLQLCSNNLEMKGTGCGLMVPVCTEYRSNDSSQWTCDMVVWKACACSQRYNSFLDNIVPHSRECHGRMLSPSELALVIPEAPPDAQALSPLVPVGECVFSGVFLIFWVLIFGSLALVIRATIMFVLRLRQRRSNSLVTKPALSKQD